MALLVERLIQPCWLNRREMIAGSEDIRLHQPELRSKGQTQIKVHGVYPLPGGIMVSGIFDNVSGLSYQANYTASNTEVAQSLGRNLAACGTRAVCTATVAVPLIAPQTLFETRRNLFDLRLSKQFTLGPKIRLRANFDIYNVFNDASILGTNNNYGPNWPRPEGTGGSGLPACSSSAAGSTSEERQRAGPAWQVPPGQSDFFNISVDGRFGSGIRLSGGVDTGRTVQDSCFTVDSPQELLNCRVVTPFKAQTQVKLNGSYQLPGDFMVSGTFQNVAGIPFEANYAATTAEIAT